MDTKEEDSYFLHFLFTGVMEEKQQKRGLVLLFLLTLNSIILFDAFELSCIWKYYEKWSMFGLDWKWKNNQGVHKRSNRVYINESCISLVQIWVC